MGLFKTFIISLVFVEMIICKYYSFEVLYYALINYFIVPKNTKINLYYFYVYWLYFVLYKSDYSP